MSKDNGASADADQALVQAPSPTVSALSGFDPSRCSDCRGANPVWFAPNAIWNLVMGGPDAKDDPGGYCCPLCFITRAEAVGFSHTVWEMRPETIMGTDLGEAVASIVSDADVSVGHGTTLGRHRIAAHRILDTIAMETRGDTTAGRGPQDDSAGPKDIAR